MSMNKNKKHSYPCKNRRKSSNNRGLYSHGHLMFEILEDRDLLSAGTFTLFTDSTLSTSGLVGSYVDKNLREYSNQDDWRETQKIAGTRVDTAIDFDTNNWGTRSKVNLTGGTDENWDLFSVQWDGYLKVNTLSRYATSSDDGSRLWIDLNQDGTFQTDERVDNHWGTGQSMTRGDLSPVLDPGLYSIRIQYEENGGGNSIQLESFAAFEETPVDPNTGLVLDFDNAEKPFAGKEGETPLLQTNVTVVDGKIGNGVHVGSTGQIVYEAEGNISSQQGTIAFWYKPDDFMSNSNSLYVLFELRNASKNRQMGIVVDGALNLVTPFFGDNRDSDTVEDRWETGNGYGVSSLFQPNEWHHIAITWNCALGDVRLFIDNVLLGEKYGVSILPTLSKDDTITIGGASYENQGMKGTLDEFVIVNRMLSASELANYYIMGLEKGTLSSPVGVAVDSKDRVIAVDSHFNFVSIYDANDVEIKKFGGYGSDNDKLINPTAVAVDASDRIYVVDTGNNRIQVYDSEGEFLFNFGGQGTGRGQFNAPEGICIDTVLNKIYIADTGNHRIQCFNLKGVIDSTFATNGVLGGLKSTCDHTGFWEPTDVAVHPTDGLLYIADRVNSRLEVYNRSGKYIRTHLSVFQPQAIVFDKKGNLYIAGEDTNGHEYRNGRIRILFAGEEFAQAHFWGGDYDDLGNITSGIALKSDGRIVFSDTLNKRLVATRYEAINDNESQFTENVTDVSIENRGTYVTFRWTTAKACISSVKYSFSLESNRIITVADNTKTCYHEITIRGLSPLKILDYQIGYENSFGNLLYWSENDRINTGVPQDSKVIQRINAVGLIYMDTKLGNGYVPISEEEAKIREERFYRVAEFYWQNSGFNLWIDFQVFRITRDITDTTALSIWGVVDSELSSLGFTAKSKILGLWACGDIVGGNYGGSGAVFGNACVMGQWCTSDDFVAIHEMNHSMDSLYGYYGVLEKYEGNHGIWGIPNGEGLDYSINGMIIGNMYSANYATVTIDNSPENWIVVDDKDDDGIPDDTPTRGLTNPLAITEKTLGSSPSKKDTDNDGLSDFEEAVYFPWSGLDLTSSDTDGDGIPDNVDLNPAYVMSNSVKKETVVIDGVINENEGWTCITNHWGYDNLPQIRGDNNEHYQDTITYASWDNQYLYLAIDYQGWGNISIRIDGSADNWYWGTDEFVLNLSSWSDTPSISVMTGSPDIYYKIDEGGGWSEFYDTDPMFTRPYKGRYVYDKANEGLGYSERLMTEADLLYKKTNDADNKYRWEVAIPWSADVLNFVGYDSKVIGLTINALGDSLFNTDRYGKIQLTLSTLKTPVITSISSVKSTSLDISWNAVPYADKYLLQYSTDGNFSTFVEKEYSTADTKTMTNLSINTKYYFRVKALADGSYKDSDYSAVVSATTDKIILSTPALSVLNKGADFVTVNVDTVANASAYSLQYSTNYDFTGATTQTATSGSNTISGLNGYTIHYIRVKAIGSDNYADSAYSSTVIAVTDKISLSIPTISMMTTGSNDLTVHVESVLHASGYYLQFATNPNFINATGQTVSSGNNKMTDLNPNTKYYLRVKATGTNPYADSEYSVALLTITDKMTLTIPTLSVTAQGSDFITLDVKSVSYASGYSLQYSTRSDFADAITSTVSKGTNTVSELSANTKYYIRIKALGTGNYIDSDYSSCFLATTDQITLSIPTLSITTKDVCSITVMVGDVNNASGYTLQYSTEMTFANAETRSVSAGTNRIGDLPGYLYYFRVKANGSGIYKDSAYSEPVSATTLKEKPVVRFEKENYSIQEGCSFCLTAEGSTEENLVYYWNLSNQEGDEYDTNQDGKSFWISPEEMALNPGIYTIGLKAVNEYGIESESVSTTLTILEVSPCIRVERKTSLEGQLLRMDLNTFFTGNRAVRQWTINWGDDGNSALTTVDCLSNSLTVIHHYGVSEETKSYPITLTFVDSNNHGGNTAYYLGTHTLAKSQVDTPSESSNTILESSVLVPEEETKTVEIISGRSETLLLEQKSSISFRRKDPGFSIKKDAETDHSLRIVTFQPMSTADFDSTQTGTAFLDSALEEEIDLFEDLDVVSRRQKSQMKTLLEHEVFANESWDDIFQLGFE